ncbi:MAG: beta-ketoacyl-ACP synthase II [Planctomycetes bacterium]|nr:beta-ketoacyl-ACP synthase II [Planctomycetota bacterium]
MSKRRVVITGMGAICALGRELETIWAGLLAGRSGATPITRFDTSQFATRFACEVVDPPPEGYFSVLERKRLDRFTEYALYAADRAVADSGLDFEKLDRERIGSIVATGIGGLSGIEEQYAVLKERGARRVTPFFVPMIMSNAPAGQIAIRFGIRGTCYATSSACASAGHSIGLALRTIQWGEADVVVTGGSEAATTELGLAGFCAAKALSSRNEEPTRASRPFDRERDGFVMGEGAAILVLEEFEHARRRGARIYAELKGFGSTDDAFHITAPAEDGDGATRAMKLAVKESGIDLSTLDYVNAHGTSTPLNDKIETLAIKRAFGDRAAKLMVSSTKSMIGHLLGASAAVELVVTALSVSRGVVHQTLNLENPDPECDLDYVPGAPREARVRNAISNSLGFGGHNTSLLVGKVD